MNFIQKGFLGDTSVWFYILTIVLVFVGIQFAGIPLILAAFFTVDGDLQKFQEGALTNFMEIGMDSNLYLFLMIFTFMIAIFVLFLCVKYLHKRAFVSIITAREKIDWKRVFFAFVLWGGISMLTIILSIFLSPEDFVWNFKPLPFLILVFISFVFLPFQTSAEEFIFRGYLMQGFGILAKNRWVPLFLTSTIFGLLHGMNPEIDKGKVRSLAAWI